MFNIFLVSSAILYIYLIYTSPVILALICAGIFAYYLCQNSPLRALAILIWFLPYGENPFFNSNLSVLPGIKLLNLIALFVIIIFFLNYKKSLKMEKYVVFFSLILISLLIVTIVRALPHLNQFAHLLGTEVTRQKFILSYLIKPLISFIPLIVIVKFVREEKDIQFIILTILISVFILSVFLLGEYILNCHNKLNINYVRNFFGNIMGLHTNQIACFYILTFPLLIEEVIVRKTTFSFLNLFISICATGILYSRTAYVLLIFSVLFYLFISKKIKMLPVMLIFFTILIMYLPSTIKERADVGLSDRNVDEISAGRVDRIWLPLINEYLHDSGKLLIGNGKYSIYTTKVFERGSILNVSHPHNMYLGVILDSGITGLLMILFIFWIIIKKIIYSIPLIKKNTFKEYQFASLAGIIGYLFAGFTGRSLFPELQNFFLWVLLGLSISMIRINHNSYIIFKYEKNI